MEQWEIIEKEKVNLKHGFWSMPEEMYELMEQDERMKKNESNSRNEK